MTKLPWFKPRPLKVGDRYLLDRNDQVVEVTSEIEVTPETWPRWITHEVRYVNRDGTLSPFTDLTAGYGFVNCWGTVMIRTRWQLLRHRVGSWCWEQRRSLADRIYPR